MTDAAGTGPPPEQLRETLMKKTVPDLIKTCKAAGIKGYSNKRREELIDLLVRKRPRPDEQVHSARTGRHRSRLSGLCLVVLYCADSVQRRS